MAQTLKLPPVPARLCLPCNTTTSRIHKNRARGREGSRLPGSLCHRPESQHSQAGKSLLPTLKEKKSGEGRNEEASPTIQGRKFHSLLGHQSQDATGTHQKTIMKLWHQVCMVYLKLYFLKCVSQNNIHKMPHPHPNKRALWSSPRSLLGNV